ncbi:PepSY domain-containing protein [Rudaea sp.]|uniref:PepSY domain-containing protein n=1 Tax=Rudaea sp. TaxID=2136325 RepID=UPI002ED57BD4
MKTRRTFIASLPALLLAANVAHAQDGGAHDKADAKARKKQAQQEAFAAMQRGEILPLTKILAIAQSRIAGDVVEVEFKGGPVYEVKVLTASGRVREVVLDARNGNVIKIEDE